MPEGKKQADVQPDDDRLLFIRFIIRLVKPLRYQLMPIDNDKGPEAYLEESIGALSDLLGLVLVDILLAGVSAPLLGDFLIEDVGLVERHEGLGGDASGEEIVHVGRKPNESLEAAKKGLLVLLAGDQLYTSALFQL
jgi:hypothetical protein